MFISMYNLATTADIYLSPALEYMTLKFGMSDSLAGVTFLAFGNGAPDVFSAISAGVDEESDGILTATKSISVILGGTFFVSSIVVIAACYNSNLNEDKTIAPLRMIRVTPTFFKRDIFFFFISVSYMLCIFLFVGYFTIYTSIVFLVNYCVYVIIVVIHSKQLKQARDIVETEDNKRANLFNEFAKNSKRMKGHLSIEDFDAVVDKVRTSVRKPK